MRAIVVPLHYFTVTSTYPSGKVSRLRRERRFTNGS